MIMALSLVAVKNYSRLWSTALRNPGTTAKGKVVRTSRCVVLDSFLIAVLDTFPLRGGRVLFRRVISSRSHTLFAIAIRFDKPSPLEMVSTWVFEDEVH